MAYPQHTVGSDQPAHDTAKVNGVALHYAHADDGPLILFLHGFPQCCISIASAPTSIASGAYFDRVRSRGLRTRRHVVRG